ncbi:hypothetical protein Taro_016499 [Colocasia esculenta]|uniref:Uncharacterized protein n=1 Tax=Colocasia esculenta TaxID=4460 RepID=A0A843UQF3_COLES|nr:hypothetical protein [Colocasia esculenta]
MVLLSSGREQYNATTTNQGRSTHTTPTETNGVGHKAEAVLSTPAETTEQQVRMTSHHKHCHLRPLQGRGPTSRTTPGPGHTARNERRTVLRGTLTRTTVNGSGKLLQNTRQPSDAPQPRGQRDNNKKCAQHSPGETSLPPEPIEKSSRSTSLEFTTSQHQADNKCRQVSQCSTGDATLHTKHLLSSTSRAQRTGIQGQTHNNHNTHPNNKGVGKLHTSVPSRAGTQEWDHGI